MHSQIPCKFSSELRIINTRRGDDMAKSCVFQLVFIIFAVAAAIGAAKDIQCFLNDREQHGNAIFFSDSAGV